MNSKHQTLRYWLIIWLYIIVFGHLATGITLAWFSGLEVFNQYHQSILDRFGVAQANTQNLQEWWISLFGATVQNLAVFMGILTYLGNKLRSATVWMWMIIGLVIWAPQDMLISLRIDFWLHVWIDVVALTLMLPPLIALWRIDRVKSNANN